MIDDEAGRFRQVAAKFVSGRQRDLSNLVCEVRHEIVTRL